MSARIPSVETYNVSGLSRRASRELDQIAVWIFEDPDSWEAEGPSIPIEPKPLWKIVGAACFESLKVAGAAMPGSPVYPLPINTEKSN